MAEIWKDIPGYEGRYQASTLGQIRSVNHRVNRYSGFTRSVKGRILKPGKFCRNGHVSVVLGKDTNGIPVQHLIMQTFVGPRPEKADIRHLDGNPLNNCLDNLCYGTRTDNILDVYRQGQVWRKLSTEQVTQIKKLLSEGIRGSEIAPAYNVSQSTISAIKRGRTFWWLSMSGVISKPLAL